MVGLGPAWLDTTLLYESVELLDLTRDQGKFSTREEEQQAAAISSFISCSYSCIYSVGTAGVVFSFAVELLMLFSSRSGICFCFAIGVEAIVCYYPMLIQFLFLFVAYFRLSSVSFLFMVSRDFDLFVSFS